ncbi:MAG: ABC transporter substrate-binding protein [Actinomycetota bacterium]|nr:ABC transporter substrate-binding protein [Actinomycetota bacterium]
MNVQEGNDMNGNLSPEQTLIDEETKRPGFDRRQFIKSGVGVAGFAAMGTLLAACDSSDDAVSTTLAADTTEVTEVILSQSDLPELDWQMTTSWPGSLIGTIGAGAQIFADELAKMTGGKFKITPRVAGEIVGGLEVLPTVRDGGVEAGHTASYYYVGINSATQFGTAVPFGLTSRQQNAWLYEAGGLEMMRELYAEEFGIIQFPAGNTGVQMGGWFTKEINSVADLQGLKMRIPGLAGRSFNNLGAEQVTVAGGDIITSIETGAIDAAEWVGPYDDLILGLGELGTEVFNYHPGWWEPGSTLEVQLPLTAWNELPEEYKAAVENAAKAANIGTMAKYDVLNSEALKQVKEVAEIREFPEDVLTAFKTDFEGVLDAEAASNGAFGEILGPWREFRDAVQEWHSLAEASMLRAAAL